MNQPHDAPMTREEQLAEINEIREHGSRNFHRYRRRAYIAFAVLAVTNALALYLTIHNASVQRDQLARSVRQVTFVGCVSGNDLRMGLRTVVRATIPLEYLQLRRLALEAFAERNCAAAANHIK